MQYSARSKEEVEDEEGRRKTPLHAREEEGGGGEEEEEEEEGNPSLSFLRKRSERVKCIFFLGGWKVAGVLLCCQRLLVPLVI